LAQAGIDAVNLHQSDWSAGLVTLFHRFGRLAFAWDAQHERVLTDLVRMGVDGIYSDHVDRLVEALSAAG
jgi:glycerophosphoryl diester phosphodiesterase